MACKHSSSLHQVSDEQNVVMTEWQSEMDLWEYQRHPLTAGHLSLGDPAYADLPVLVAVYDGTGERAMYVPAEIGYVGSGDRPDAVVITVIPQSSPSD
jgi:hypothetical protein